MVNPETLIKVMKLVWASGGFAFGGTARDLIRGEAPNDLDIRIGENCMEALRAIGAHREFPRDVLHGEAYYDSRIVFDDGTSVDIKYGFCEVTDCDVNLIKLYDNRVELLYVPEYLKGHTAALPVILSHIGRKEFVPLIECPPHRQYRWAAFTARGWKRITL